MPPINPNSSGLLVGSRQPNSGLGVTGSAWSPGLLTQARLPSARRYSSKFSLLSIFQYPLKSTGILGTVWGWSDTEKAGVAVGSAWTPAATALRVTGGPEMSALGGLRALRGGDSWIPSVHKARRRIHCNPPSAQCTRAGRGQGRGLRRGWGRGRCDTRFVPAAGHLLVQNLHLFFSLSQARKMWKGKSCYWP